MPGKTVGLVGFGEIGRKVAKRLVGFDVRILCYDPYATNVEYGVEMVELETLMRESDFVSIHARMCEETKHIINANRLGLMKSTAYLINTSRSGLVDEEALYNVLKEKKIAGAMLDVFEKEPPGMDYPLVTLENVTITPHMAGGSKDAFYQSPVKLAEEMKKIWNKETTRYLIK